MKKIIKALWQYAFIICSCWLVYRGLIFGPVVMLLTGILIQLIQIREQITESRMFDKHSFTQDELRVLKAALINMKKPERGNLS